MKGLQVPVSTRALIQRINRALRDDERVVKATRGERARVDLGSYYLLDPNHNVIVETHVNLEALARKYDALRKFETWDTGDGS